MVRRCFLRQRRTKNLQTNRKKGTYDINDEKDAALLKKLIDLHSNRRVLLEYDADAGDGTTIREHDTCVIPYDRAPREKLEKTDDQY